MWQLDDDLQAILAYLESSGLSREVIKARIFQIFVDKETPGTIVLKAGEMLLSFSDDDGYTGDMPYSQLIIVQQLTKKILGAKDDNLDAIIRSLSPSSDSEGDTESIPSFLRRVSVDHVPAVPASPAQSSDYESADPRQAGTYQAVSDRDASETWQDGDNFGSIPAVDIGPET
jgi:hypothetical protein